MAQTVLHSFDHREAIAKLCAADHRLARVIERSIEFRLELPKMESPFEALLEAIVYQSISGKAAATIFERVKAIGGNRHCPTPEQILAAPKRVLRKAGLSRAKIAAMKDLTQKTLEGVVPTLEEAHAMSDAELVERLISVRGIGAWTVEMFLIFRLGRPDVLPIHDLGVKKGWSVTYGKKHVPKPKELLAFGERWRPYRTVASWYMWRAFERAGYAATNKIRPPKVRKRKPAKAVHPKRPRRKRL